MLGPSLSTRPHVVLVTEADSWIGFYCAWGLLKHIKEADTSAGTIAKVACAVRSRDNDFVRELESMGADIREWSDSEADARSLRDGLFRDDVSALALVPIHNPETMHHVTKTFIDAAEETNGRVRYLCLWSALGALHYPHHGGTEHGEERESHSHWHHIFRHFVKIEERVRETTIEEHTIMRIGFVQQQLFGLANVIQNRGLLPWTSPTNKIALLNAKDLARGTANVFADPKLTHQLNKKTLFLTGTAAYTGQEIAEIANKTLQAGIKLEQVAVNDMAKILHQNADADEVEIRMTLGYFELLDRDKLDMVTSEMKKLLLDREPTNLDHFFKENADSFRPQR